MRKIMLLTSLAVLMVSVISCSLEATQGKNASDGGFPGGTWESGITVHESDSSFSYGEKVTLEFSAGMVTVRLTGMIKERDAGNDFWRNDPDVPVEKHVFEATPVYQRRGVWNVELRQPTKFTPDAVVLWESTGNGSARISGYGDMLEIHKVAF